MDEEGWGSDSDKEDTSSLPHTARPATEDSSHVANGHATLPPPPPAPPTAPNRANARHPSQNQAALAAYAAPSVAAAHSASLQARGQASQQHDVHASPPAAKQHVTPVVQVGSTVINPLLRAAAGAAAADSSTPSPFTPQAEDVVLVPRKMQPRASKTPTALQAELLSAMRPSGADTPPAVAWRRGAVLDDLGARLYACLMSSAKNRYLWANVVYLVYAFGILYVDLVAYPAYTTALAADLAALNTTAIANGSDDGQFTTAKSDRMLAYINRLYLGFAVVHMVNSFMYIVSWWPVGYGWNDWVMIPEYLNVMEATLYLASSTLYPQTNDIFSSTTLLVHHLEVSGAVIELAAAIGWYVTWWATYPRKLGRGWSFDDPDFVANLLTLLPSFVYIAYNIQVLSDLTQYGTNFLYVSGDIIYTVGSIFYFFAALRDDGWLWFLPLAGQLPCCRPARNVEDVPLPPRKKPSADATDASVWHCGGLFSLCPGGSAPRASPLSQRPSVTARTQVQSHAGTEMTRRVSGTAR